MTWFEHAACRGMGPEIFFTGRGKHPTQALAVCHSCPVANQCLDYCVSLPRVNEYPTLGVWGGTTGNQRDKLGLRSERRGAA